MELYAHGQHEGHRRFPFRELAMPYLLLGEEQCDDLHDRVGKIVPKVRGGRGLQFLKVLKKNLWMGIPMLEGVPHSCLPTPENTLLIDDIPTKSILNPPGNAILLDPWKCDRNDNFLDNKLGPYIRRLASHPDVFRSSSCPTPLAIGL